MPVPTQIGVFWDDRYWFAVNTLVDTRDTDLWHSSRLTVGTAGRLLIVYRKCYSSTIVEGHSKTTNAACSKGKYCRMQHLVPNSTLLNLSFAAVRSFGGEVPKVKISSVQERSLSLLLLVVGSQAYKESTALIVRKSSKKYSLLKD